MRFLGTDRLYTYAYDWDTSTEERALAVGDRVEVPPNFVQEDGGSGTVAALGSLYDGPLQNIVRRIPDA
ncbi:hypothetical protein [Streptomyces solincola]|uniref:hypothetical protein n=1 Tax=Streptomyces solincola TaxID=2100817 RepID=UPI0011B22069|nr:hypothetical protein [Streptomyces solincola]